MLKRHALWAAVIHAGLLSACGGGGGGDAVVTPPASTTTAVTLNGVAAKGLMKAALVTAHAVRSDGSVDAATLAGPVETQADGSYELKFSATKAQPYVVKVAAKADGSTTHVDEVQGEQTLPAGFNMRAVLIAPSTDTLSTRATLTPFGEMAVQAAERAGGGVTRANAEQAISTVTQILGFDPAKVAVKAADAAGASTDEKKLAVLLTAVAKMAEGGALGCAAGATAGDKTRCVVDKLAAAASTTSLKLQMGSGSAGTNVSAALSDAVAAVLAVPSLARGVDASLLVPVVATLGCTDASSCTPATASSGGSAPAPGALALAIANAKFLFTELTTDWQMLFSRGGVAAGVKGAVNAEAYKFQLAMAEIQNPVEMLVEDVGALVSCIDLYNDYRAGRVTDTSLTHVALFGPNRARGFGWVPNDGSADFSTFNATGCTLYQDSATSVVATNAANARYIGISVNFFVSRRFDAAGNYTTRWRHGFTVTPSPVADGSFSYNTRARETVTTCLVGSGCAQTSNIAIQKAADGSDRAPYAGTVTTATDTAGHIVAFGVKGELAGAFLSGGHVLANDHHAIDWSGTRTLAADGRENDSIGGTLVSYNADGSVAGRLAVKKGTLTAVPYALDANYNSVSPLSPRAVNGPAGNSAATLDLDVSWTTGEAEFDGQLAATDPVWDKSLSVYAPTKMTLKGVLRNGTAATATDFLTGTLTFTSSGYDRYLDDATPDGPANFFTVGLSFVGQATAPGRPILELTAGGSMKNYLEQLDNLDLRYRALVGGTPRTVVDITTTRNAAGNWDLTLSEAASGLSLAWPDEAVSGDLKKGDLIVGTLDRASRRLTFADGSFISLDIGL